MPVPMVANFRGAGTGRWEGRGAKVFLQILTDQLTPTWTRWGRLCPPKSLLALQIFKPSDIPVNFIFLSRFTILSTYHYLFFFFFSFFFFFEVLSRNYEKLFWGNFIYINSREVVQIVVHSHFEWVSSLLDQELNWYLIGNSNSSWTDKHSSHFSTAKEISVKARNY